MNLTTLVCIFITAWALSYLLLLSMIRKVFALLRMHQCIIDGCVSRIRQLEQESEPQDEDYSLYEHEYFNYRDYPGGR